MGWTEAQQDLAPLPRFSLGLQQIIIRKLKLIILENKPRRRQRTTKVVTQGDMVRASTIATTTTAVGTIVTIEIETVTTEIARRKKSANTTETWTDQTVAPKAEIMIETMKEGAIAIEVAETTETVIGSDEIAMRTTDAIGMTTAATSMIATDRETTIESDRRPWLIEMNATIGETITADGAALEAGMTTSNLAALLDRKVIAANSRNALRTILKSLTRLERVTRSLLSFLVRRTIDLMSESESCGSVTFPRQ